MKLVAALGLLCCLICSISQVRAVPDAPRNQASDSVSIAEKKITPEAAVNVGIVPEAEPIRATTEMTSYVDSNSSIGTFEAPPTLLEPQASGSEVNNEDEEDHQQQSPFDFIFDRLHTVMQGVAQRLSHNMQRNDELNGPHMPQHPFLPRFMMHRLFSSNDDSECNDTNDAQPEKPLQTFLPTLRLTIHHFRSFSPEAPEEEAVPLQSKEESETSSSIPEDAAQTSAVAEAHEESTDVSDVPKTNQSSEGENDQTSTSEPAMLPWMFVPPPPPPMMEPMESHPHGSSPWSGRHPRRHHRGPRFGKFLRHHPLALVGLGAIGMALFIGVTALVVSLIVRRSNPVVSQYEPIIAVARKA